jgi:hypothetical protein
VQPAATESVEKPAAPMAELKLSALSAMKKGDHAKITVSINAASQFRSAVLGLKFDPAKAAVRSVSFGDVFGATLANTSALPFLNENGKMYVSLSTQSGVASTAGTLAVIEIEALADGTPEIALEKDVLNFLTVDGKNFAVKF